MQQPLQHTKKDVGPEPLSTPTPQTIDRIWVDIDGLRDDSLGRLVDLAYAMPDAHIHVFGVRGLMGAWRNAFASRRNAEMVVTPVVAAGATVVALTAAAVSIAPDARGQRWLLIGAARGYLALEHILAGFGIRAERHAALTGDVLGSLISGKDLLASSLRSLYLDMRKSRRSVVHVGILANEAVRRWPDLEDPNIRRRLFGTRRFGPLFKAAGLVIEGDDVVGV